MLKNMAKIFTLNLTVLLLSISPAFAGSGKIAGRVVDEQTGAPLAAAQVIIPGTSMGGTTNSQGQYFILNVPPGTYTLKVSFMGFATKEIGDVHSQLDATTIIDIRIKSSAIAGDSLAIIANPPGAEITMTTTRISWGGRLIDNALPVNELNEILQTSVMTQSMRGANKAGLVYLIDGVNITDLMTAVGGGTDPYSFARRNLNPISSTTGEFSGGYNIDVRGRSSDMVQTSVGVTQTSVAEVNVMAGIVNAEYNASAGIINIATQNGGKNYSGKLYIKSSAGGLNHAGPNCYTATSSNPAILNGKSAAGLYDAYKAELRSSGNEYYVSKLNWTPDSYEYGAEPRIIAEFNFGGPLTNKGNFFFAGNFLNDHGRFPGEFQRNLGLALKLNYAVSESDQLTAYGKIDDWGQLFGWTNRSYSYTYQFWLEGQPVWDRSGFITYLKHLHIFNPASFLESTISYVANEKTWGYKPVNGKLDYDNYGDTWLIVDTKAKAEQYLLDPGNRLFIAGPSGSPEPIITTLGQARFLLARYTYENLRTSTLTLANNYTNQINFHQQLKGGVEYKLNTIDEYQHKTTTGAPDPTFKFDTVDYNIHPWSLGVFIQDKIEYEDLVVNLGLRFDAYNLDTKLWPDYFAPVKWDTTAAGQALMVWNRGQSSQIHAYFSPRIGVSHRITKNAAMHYSWGICTTPPNSGYWLQNYNAFVNATLPMTRNPDPDPEKAIAYEIGLCLALANNFNIDITAYYRDVRNGSALDYSIYQDRMKTNTNFKWYSYTTNWGYRDSHGVELNVWRRSTSDRFFGLFGLAGNLSLAYSYDKTSVNGNSISEDADFTTTWAYDDNTVDYNWDLVNFWPTYSRRYRDVKAKITLLWDFPHAVKLATLATYSSPWRYPKKLNVTKPRFEEMLYGESFFQVDLRLTKYLPVGKHYGGVFIEVLNVLNRENILAFDNYGDTNYDEQGLGPYGMFNRPTDQYGNPLTGIAREVYLGFEFSF